MKQEYKCHPAFESIKSFRIGDRVRFHSAYKDSDGELVSFRGDVRLCIRCKDDGGLSYDINPHFKACRKLEPVEPVQQVGYVWSGDVGLHGHRPLWPEKHGMGDGDNGEWIEFRSVLKRKASNTEFSGSP